MVKYIKETIWVTQLELVKYTTSHIFRLKILPIFYVRDFQTGNIQIKLIMKIQPCIKLVHFK